MWETQVTSLWDLNGEPVMKSETFIRREKNASMMLRKPELRRLSTRVQKPNPHLEFVDVKVAEGKGVKCESWRLRLSGKTDPNQVMPEHRNAAWRWINKDMKS
ncbi:hypothetical protein VNO78_20083 [Psophocarpus tetragonolobus]|uniref:Uncharacterized protein n=1 Tax=Psophocarpus tetragonolobus TaxID=3891 RepID=A0AAN9S9P7_PSOTE